MKHQPSTIMRVGAAVIGNAFEWYDFSIYASLTAVISSVFFPVDPADPTTQVNAVLATTAVFGVGFLMRPVGGVVLGVIGDKYGRRTGMVLGMALMAVSILMMVCAPSYAAAGILAPLIIVLARLVQGFSLGGQFGTSTAFLIEMAPPGRTGLYGSWQMVGQVAAFAAGTAFGVLLTECYTPAELAAGMWRLPFVFGLVILPLTWYVRHYLEESKTFVALKKERASGKVEGLGMSLVGHTRQLLVSVGLIAASAVSFYAIYGYTVTYAKTALHMPVEQAFTAELVAACLMLVVIPIGGLLCDRFSDHRRGMLILFLAVYFCMMYPAYSWLVASPTVFKLLLVQLAISVVSGLFLGVYCTTMSVMLPARIRSTGLSIANNISVLIFGGFAQFFLTWIYKATGSQIAPVYYVMGGIALGLIGAVFMPAAEEDASSAVAAK